MSVSLSSALPFHTVPFVAAVIAGLSTFATIAVMLPASAMFLGWVAFNMASPSFATGWPITAAFRSGSHSASARR